MKVTAIAWIVAIPILLSCRGSRHSPSPESPEPIATVETQPLTRRTLKEDLVVYGTVVPGPTAKHTVSVPFESRVRTIHVRVGQQVRTGDPLIEIGPSADAKLALKQARAEAAASKTTLSSVHARFASHLATNSEVAAAERDERDAEIRVQSLVARGAGEPRTLVAAGPALVSSVPVTEGALSTAGAPLVELYLSSHLEVRFGIEVEDVFRIAPGAPLRVQDLGLPPQIVVDAVVRAVGQSINGATRLVECYASLPAASGFLLGQRVSGRLPVETGPVWAVPRAALVPEPSRMVIYTVKDGRAKSHVVRIGLENDAEAEITNEGLEDGVEVVVSGAAVLTDGMRVRRSTPGAEAGRVSE